MAICSSVGEAELLFEVMLVGTAALVAEVLVETPKPAGVADAAVGIAALEFPLVDVPALIAFPCAEKVVEEIGQPTPGPSRFCRVTAAAFKRAS